MCVGITRLWLLLAIGIQAMNASRGSPEHLELEHDENRESVSRIGIAQATRLPISL